MAARMIPALLLAVALLSVSVAAADPPQSAINYACATWPNYFPGGNCTLFYWNTIPEYMKYGALESVGALPPPPPVQPVAPVTVIADGCAPTAPLAVHHLAVVGDSITSGDVEFNPWPAFLPSYRPGLTVDNHAVSGARVAQMVPQMTAALAVPGVEAVAILGGRNDVADGRAASVIVDVLRQMIAQARTAGVEPVLVNVLPDGSITGLSTLHQGITALGVERGVRVVDPGARIADPGNPYAMLRAYVHNGAHPNDRGARRVAEAFAWAVGWMGAGD